MKRQAKEVMKVFVIMWLIAAAVATLGLTLSILEGRALNVMINGALLVFDLFMARLNYRRVKASR